MILFAADRHYDQHSGKCLYACLADDCDIEFIEEDWRCFAQPFADRYALLILNFISGCDDVPGPGPECEAHVKAYLASGKPMLLMHSASAAFWQWDWWRALVGFRWVRDEDPDGFKPSNHPIRPYKVRVCKARHPLCRQLQNMFLPEDEIYINLEQTCPATVLMQTTTEEGSFPQCYECATPWGGKVIGFLPGHKPEVIRDPQIVGNVRVLINYLLASEEQGPES